jgi:recombination protein RecA
MGENLNKALKYINEKIEKGVIRQLGDKEVIKCDVIPTGIMSFDKALGVGGFPRGRQTEVYGNESTGKTSICLHAIAEAQRLKLGEVAIIDSEHAMDLAYAKNIGVDVSKLWLVQPSCGEDSLTILEQLVTTGEFAMIVVDSVAALTPRSEIEGEMGAAHMGIQARLMSQAMRKITAPIAQKNVAVVWINQLRSKIGGYGNPMTTTGGNSLRFYTTVRIELSKGESVSVEKGEDPTISNVKGKVTKNKLASPFKTFELVNTFGYGFSKENSVLYEAIKFGIINKSGSWFAYGDTRLGQGAANVISYFKDHSELYKEIYDKTYAAILSGKTESDYVPTEEDIKLAEEETPSDVVVEEAVVTEVVEEKPVERKRKKEK